MLPYTGISGRQTHLLGGVDDLLASLEDSLTTLNTIKSSKYVSPIKVYHIEVHIYSIDLLVFSTQVDTLLLYTMYGQTISNYTVSQCIVISIPYCHQLYVTTVGRFTVIPIPLSSTVLRIQLKDLLLRYVFCYL